MSKAYAIYLCGADPLCAPCRMGTHAQCSWDGCPDCECEERPEDRKTTNRAALDAEIGTAYGPDGELLPDPSPETGVRTGPEEIR